MNRYEELRARCEAFETARKKAAKSRKFLAKEQLSMAVAMLQKTAAADIPWLLAEVERLRGELDAAVRRAEEEKEAIKESAYRFYYCDTEDSYLIGHRVDNFYYAHWHKGLGFVFDMSRYLPWGETVNGHESGNAWGIHTYPSKPREIGICEWFKGFLAQQAEGGPADDDN